MDPGSCRINRLCLVQLAQKYKKYRLVTLLEHIISVVLAGANKTNLENP